MSRQVTVLERLQLVGRHEDPDDARVQVLSLTELGARRLGAARTGRCDRFRALLSTWPDTDVRHLGDLLHRFNGLDD